MLVSHSRGGTEEHLRTPLRPFPGPEIPLFKRFRGRSLSCLPWRMEWRSASVQPRRISPPSSKGLLNYDACTSNHATVGRSHIKGESDDLVSNLIRFQQAKDSSCYSSPSPINGDRYSKKLLEVGPSKHNSDPLL